MKCFFIFSMILICLTGCSKNVQNNTQISYYNENSNIIPQELELASFSTPIIYKDENRDYNMTLTCSFLNETIVSKGETFSFCDTVR